MKKATTDEKLKRRDFLKSGAGAALAVGCFTLGLKEALVAAQRSGKPLLTDKAINARLPSPQQTEAFRKEVEAIKGDLVGYLNKHFHLVPRQRGGFKTLTRENITELNKALDKAMEQNLKITVLTKGGCERASKIRLETHFDANGLTVEALPAQETMAPRD